MRSALPERLPLCAARPGPPGPRRPRRLAKCTGLKFLEKGAQLFKVTVSCPPERGSPRAPGEPGAVLRLPPLCWRLRCLRLPPPPGEVCAGGPRHPPAASAVDLSKLSGCCRLRVNGAKGHVRRGSCLLVPRIKGPTFQAPGSGRSHSGQSSSSGVRKLWVQIPLCYF